MGKNNLLLTTADIQFVGDHEGFRSKAYRDSGGVITIGFGFTMLSRVFAEWWRAKTGRALKMGDTISRADSDMLLQRLLGHEYLPPVEERFRGFRTLKQHETGACTSVSYNAGPGSLQDRWAAALANDNVPEAAALLRRTRVTAAGTFVQGLVNRRADEARLLETGNYGARGDHAVSTAREDVRAYQEQLIALGYDVGPAGADGLAGTLTVTAVKEFQEAHRLVVDGKVGPATRAALDRAMAAKAATRNTGAAAGTAATAGAGSDVIAAGGAVDSSTLVTAVSVGVAVAVVATIIFLVYRYRTAIKARLRPAG